MTTTRQLFTFAAAIAVLSTLSWGQVRQIQMGGSMDANPQIGAGGSNRPVQGFVPINGNDIMTGNVTGLAYFHGQVGSASAYQFQGSLGSSSLSNFARQSAGNPRNGGPNLGGYSTYYLPSSTVSTAGGSLYSAPIGSGFDSALVPRSSYSAAASSSQISAINGNVNGSQAINRALPVSQLQPGSPGAVLSSPLFILRTTELQNKRPDIGQPIISQPLTPGIDAGDDTKPPVNPNQIQGLVNAGKDPRVLSQNPDFKALVGDTYRTLSDQLNQINATGSDANALTNTSTTLDTPDIDPLTGRPRTMAVLPGFPGGPGSGTTTQRARSQLGLPTAARLTELSDAELTAGSKVKPVRMAPGAGPGGGTGGGQVSAFDLMMSRAETNLKGGKYLDAAETYQAALQLKPEDPLALIGRADAEMGAGIYASAEYDLKFVFTRKPQLVALKYDVDSFIPASRQDFLLQDFKKLTISKDTGPMASFLYCYLCYQTNRTTDLQTELKTWAARPDKDDWQNVAQRAWGSSK